ncbi:B12-binding domain-containing radical SAM protein [Geomonas sp.]|uniref:B12-binding domain-containing radical SAM protein n=1 Tax=Geomonas sp. TaxID=2651584 RepID=UPI002B496A70|nr:cobalamin-dependent protein [Geomonas sp.]HJV35421.1 cobalamin-dependent protein [Geomonas sp.]
MISRILIISTSREMAPQPTVPIGAAWVAEGLQLAGFHVKLLDLCFQRDPLHAIGSSLRTFQPDGIALSVRNLDNCDFLSPVSFLPELKQMVDFIKSVTDARILIGGAGVSIMPVQLLEYLGLDHAVVGEGERAAAEFFSCPDGDALATVAGVVGRSGEMVGGPCRLPPDAVPPRLHRWVDTGRYLMYEPVLPVQGKRGCANRCLYCTYRRIEGESWRLREPGAVVDEMATLVDVTGAREFEFVDSIFNQPEGYLEALLEEILKRRLKATLRISSLAPKGITRAQIKLMERAGITSLVVTPESACDTTLAALRKDFTERDIHHAAELLAGSGINVLWCFLLGAPQEDDSSLAKTIRFINTGVRKRDAAFITTGIRVYPGTGLHQQAIEDGLLDASHNLLMPSFYFSPKLSPQEARRALEQGISDLSRCIFVSDTRQSSVSTLRRIGTLLRLPKPFWSYAGYLNTITAGRRAISREWPTLPARQK